MAAHRGHNEGTIAKRTYTRKDGTKSTSYVAQAPIGPDGRRPSLGSFKTRAEAREALKAAHVARAQGAFVPGKAPTVREWCTSWLASRTRIAHWTRVQYGLTFKMIDPYIGHRRLDQLTDQQLGMMWVQLAQGVAADGTTREPIAATTLATRHAHLSAALHAAVKSRTVPLSYNPAQDARPERGERKDIHPLTEAEVQRLFTATRDDPDYALWVVLITTGCRSGEARALRWQDIDFERRTISVNGSLYPVTGTGWVRGPTKTRKSRVVALRPNAAAALKAHRARQLEMRLAAGPEWVDQDYVFTNGRGGPLNGMFLQAHFDAACRKAGIERRTIKETRHTFATLGLVHNVPVKIISEALGHAKVGITYDTYSHVIAGLQDESLAHLDALFAGS